MNNTALSGIIVGAVVLAAAGAVMANSGYNPLQQYATVVSVEPAFTTTRTPRQVCGEEAALAQSAEAATPGAPAAPQAAPAPAQKPAEGAKPADAAQAADAAKPGGAGADAAAEGPCVVVYDTSSTQSGFDVTYELDGVQKMVRMDHDPGKRIPVEDGELVLTLR
jgi:uncharacterized protein YcfJ